MMFVILVEQNKRH